MHIEENRLIIADEVVDDDIEELKEHINNESVEIIQIDTDNISSLCLQQLFCVAKDKTMDINNSFLEKFFENISYTEDIDI